MKQNKKFVLNFLFLAKDLCLLNALSFHHLNQHMAEFFHLTKISRIIGIYEQATMNRKYKTVWRSTSWVHSFAKSLSFPCQSCTKGKSNHHFTDFFFSTSWTFFLRFYLLINETHTERGRDIGRGRSRLPAGSLMWDSIPGPWDHDPSQRQTLNHWATWVPQDFVFCHFILCQEHWLTTGISKNMIFYHCVICNIPLVLYLTNQLMIQYWNYCCHFLIVGCFGCFSYCTIINNALMQPFIRYLRLYHWIFY